MALERWHAIPTIETDAVESVTQTLHDLDTRSAAIRARHTVAVRACCTQIDRATVLSPAYVAGVRSSVTTSVASGGGSGRYRTSSNAVMAGFKLDNAARLSATGLFPNTGEHNSDEHDGIDPGQKAQYREGF